LSTRFGKYLLLRNLSVGGAIELYVAKQTGMEGFEKLVILKRLVEQHEQNRDLVDAFLNEARTAARLNHPNIVQVYDLGRVGNSFFIAMVAHTRPDAGGQPGGVVHRNICPHNVVLTYEGTVKIVDFGIAKTAMAPLTYAGVVKGSLAYMAPEQCQGQPVDGRADVFAVGVMLYELATGRSPFKRETDFLTIRAVTEEPLVPPRALKPALPEDFERIIVKALERDRERRYATAEAMQLELGAFLRRGQHETGNVVLARMMKELFSDKLARARAEAESGSYQSGSIDESLTVSIVAASLAREATPSPERQPADPSAEALRAVVDYSASVPAGGRPDPTTGVTKVEKPIDDGAVKTDVNRTVSREEALPSGSGTETAEPEPDQGRGEVTASGLDAVGMVGGASETPVEDDGQVTVAMSGSDVTGGAPGEDHEPRTSPEMVVVEDLSDRKRSVPYLRAVTTAPAPPAPTASRTATELPTVIIERTPPPMNTEAEVRMPRSTLLILGAVALVVLTGVGLLIGRLL
jgi:serine/threonine-protein kinase